ncbi:helix-turn-helix transcriptional regulator [Mycobacterium paraterrae]|uniref:Helix-turn-helix transcriptional regulator n=1 Tax=Mycobacterium paraterrae TaxID=577492 RepID=A0ABY3VGV3_9MYCO|nr:helix-turn-helix transcriptional regulator [Mycobacterium paraterrae]UMB68649.1 helix-turn-helix transcriptional regulator [Mycobacterium paraterrae]
MTAPTRLIRHRDGVPVYQYRTDPHTPLLAVIRHTDEVRDQGRHIHDFPALWYRPSAGGVYVVAAGEVLDPTHLVDLEGGIGVVFDPAALGEDGQSPWPTWRTHPLLFPFLHGRSGGLLRLELPKTRRPHWNSAIEEIEAELSGRRDGYQQAALAHLTLLLIDVARIAGDVVDDFRRSGEPLLADVFAVIDRRLGEPLSLRDVAREVGITPGHLTTVVRRRTGRTVQEWIIESRMAEARKLLAHNDIPVGEVARRVGISDPGYFSRLFRRAHGMSPRDYIGLARR